MKYLLGEGVLVLLSLISLMKGGVRNDAFLALLKQWANAKLMYCPKCKQDRPFEKSPWDGAWVCKKCGYRIK